MGARRRRRRRVFTVKILVKNVRWDGTGTDLPLPFLILPAANEPGHTRV
jgi:hypothetical protein